MLPEDGTIAPDGFQAPEQRLPTVDDSVLQGRWEITFEGDPPPGGRWRSDSESYYTDLKKHIKHIGHEWTWRFFSHVDASRILTGGWDHSYIDQLMVIICVDQLLTVSGTDVGSSLPGPCLRCRRLCVAGDFVCRCCWSYPGRWPSHQAQETHPARAQDQHGSRGGGERSTWGDCRYGWSRNARAWPGNLPCLMFFSDIFEACGWRNGRNSPASCMMKCPVICPSPISLGGDRRYARGEDEEEKTKTSQTR